ncbi:MAG: hypothetical protein JNL68_14930 [Burkholderiales bacterium]|nr:hypothetical protein [Burkholderiales bacterium]
MGRRMIWVFWPAFIVGGTMTTIFFALVDPGDIGLFGEPLGWGRTAVYSAGFFLFWAFAAGSSALTCFLQRSPFEINRCPLPAVERPAGCPKRENADGCCD